MKDELITKETAILAKDKGFNLEEPCRCGGFPECICEQCKPDDYVYQPTQSLLQRWLREVHKIHIEIINFNPGDGTTRYEIDICVPNEEDKCFHNKGTYEEVLEIGLQKALNLIP